MIDRVVEKLIAAHKLEEHILDAVFDYVDQDVTKTQFGLNAAVRASILLIKGSTMSNETRMALAQSIFMDLTDDLPLADMDSETQSQ